MYNPIKREILESPPAPPVYQPQPGTVPRPPQPVTLWISTNLPAKLSSILALGIFWLGVISALVGRYMVSTIGGIYLINCAVAILLIEGPTFLVFLQFSKSIGISLAQKPVWVKSGLYGVMSLVSFFFDLAILNATLSLGTVALFNVFLISFIPRINLRISGPSPGQGYNLSSGGIYTVGGAEAGMNYQNYTPPTADTVPQTSTTVPHPAARSLQAK